MTAGYARRLLRGGQLIIRGRIRTEHPDDVDIRVIASNVSGSMAGVVECIWTTTATPQLHRGSNLGGIPSEAIYLSADSSHDQLAAIIDSLGQSERLWLLEEPTLWAVRSNDAIVEVCDIRGPGCAFALTQLMVLRTALANIQFASFGALNDDWQTIIAGLRQRLPSVIKQAASNRAELVGI